MGNYVFFKNTWKKIFPFLSISLILTAMRRVQKDSPAGARFPLEKIYVDLRISDSLLWRRDIQMLQTHRWSVVMPTIMKRRFFKVPELPKSNVFLKNHPLAVDGLLDFQEVCNDEIHR